MIGLAQSLPSITATSTVCPQCGAAALIKSIEPHPVSAEEKRTFECRECGLPRTYTLALKRRRLS
jgi:predicted RNA-binding Zn-ribbon protein involved in translation (DUF1610 family)